MTAELEVLIEQAALEAVEAYKAIQRQRKNDLSRGTLARREYNNEYQREWRRVRIEIDPEYREVERAKFRQQYRENPEAWRRARVERERARQKTSPALEYQREYRRKRRARDPEFVERERERDRRRYYAKKEASNV